MTTLVSPASTSIESDIPFDEGREQLRQNALEELGLLNTAESESFDRITRLASRLFEAPVSAVSLTDRSRQWFKSHIGTAGREIPREAAPSAEVTRSQQFLNIPDLLEDTRFAASPLAQAGIRFYAGAPLTTRSGYTLGAMCVLDSKPRAFTSEQQASLVDLAAIVMAQIELQHESGRIDSASGLPNRHQLYDDLEDQCRKQAGAARVLVLIELTDLRHVNDAISVLGASYLDTLIRTAAATIRLAVGRAICLYQVGFASLAMLLDEEEVFSWDAAETIALHLKAPTHSNGIPITITAALGVSPFRLGEVSPQDALRTAVSAAHEARQAQLDCAVYSVDNDAAHRRRFHLLTHARESLEQQQHFSLVYQPRLDLHTGLCSSAEALIRWTHPTLGSVSPGDFIPLVEQTALTRPLTQWVIANALRQIGDWQDRGLAIRLSINISARNLEEEDFADLLAEALTKYGIRPDQIELEFTESALIRHKNRVLAQLTTIRHMGVELAIDDFGTGYSSLAYLHELPATVVKLDQSFMRGLAHSARDQSMVRSMISMSRDIGYRVVAEGVESEDVLELLKMYGCDEIQGYYIARPLPALRFEEFILRRNTQSQQAA